MLPQQFPWKRKRLAEPKIAALRSFPNAVESESAGALFLDELSLIRSVALLVLFTGAAWTGVVASHFIARSALRRSFCSTAASHTRNFKFALLLALKLTLNFINGC